MKTILDCARFYLEIIDALETHDDDIWLVLADACEEANLLGDAREIRASIKDPIIWEDCLFYGATSDEVKKIIWMQENKISGPFYLSFLQKD